MAEELTQALVNRAERGDTLGSDAVLTAARARLDVNRGLPPWWLRAPAFAMAFVATLVLVGAVLLASRLMVTETPPAETVPVTATTVPPTTAAPTPSVTTTTWPTEGIEVAPPDRVFDLALASDRSLWAATDGGAVLWDLATESPTVYSEWDGLPDRHVYHVAVAPDGTVWAAGRSWLARFDGVVWTELEQNVLPDLSHPVGDMAVARDGALWVAAGADTLIRIDAVESSTYQVPEPWTSTEPWSMSLALDPSGTVWASSLVSGVLSFDGAWQDFGVDDGLPSYSVGNVATAPDGSVWFGGETDDVASGGGIARYQDGQWTTYTTADGLLADNGRVAIGPAGDVWVVHSTLPAGGISYFDGSNWRTYQVTGGSTEGVVSAGGTLWLRSDRGIVGFDGTETSWLVAGLGAVPPPRPPGDTVIFEPVESLESIRLSTAIGEIEFTTLAVPEMWDEIWWLTETAHGVVGSTFPGETLVGSIDGQSWSVVPATEWPGDWVAAGDDLLVFGPNDAVRLEWNGSGWTQTISAENGRNLLGATAGPQGIVAVRGTGVLYSTDGDVFNQATDPPDPSLHTPSGSGCSAPGWVSEGREPQIGPMAATEFGFVALAARSGDPICEPLVWVSLDGDGWAATAEQSPFGEGAFIHDLTASGDTIVAVGGVSPTEAAVWTSNDGISWERGTIEAAELWQAAGGDRGFILTGHRRSNGEIGAMWFSPDGRTWDGPYERPPGWGDLSGLFYSVAMLDDRIIGTGRQFHTPGMAMGGVVVGKFIDK